MAVNRISKISSLAILWTTLCASSTLAHADGLSDLKAALARLQGPAAVKAVLEAKTWSKQGEGKDAEEKNGVANVFIEEGQRGLHIHYSKELLAKLDTEELAKEKDPKVKTPTLSALKEINSSELRPLIYAAGSLSRAVEKANFKSEKVDTFNGKPARLLSFDLSIDKISEKDRKYVKKYEGKLDIWVAADGTPLASRQHESVSGRAFVVISFESTNDDDQIYAQVGERLVTTRRESKSSGSGAGERGESRTVKTLQLQS
ncbi:hypothetical protein LPB67_01705 [Undibacterium sp. Jales W-56]|uniref:hypothetical protein n=1 Tax=Undibacterium sp. Jales W-56 TaxID=2897325 RepID=UPI0021D08C7E|nr:hypothetical protein [Undibacterium sp. Jales W-56]MCU6432492.1 hypothetical protein [Undibacterium sp. Jales W-56]